MFPSSILVMRNPLPFLDLSEGFLTELKLDLEFRYLRKRHVDNSPFSVPFLGIPCSRFPNFIRTENPRSLLTQPDLREWSPPKEELIFRNNNFFPVEGYLKNGWKVTDLTPVYPLNISNLFRIS